MERNSYGFACVDLNKLRTFVAVAKAGSITEAARRLYRTQPAISSQLKDLEQETHLCLFERRNAKIYLTNEGKTLFEYSVERIAELEEMAVRLRNELKSIEGIIHVGIIPDACDYVITSLIYKFRKKYPKARFHIRSMQHVELEKELLDGELDVAFMAMYEQPLLLEKYPYLTLNKIMMASPEYLNQFAKIETPADILDKELIGLDNRLGSFRFWFGKHGFKKLATEVNKLNPSFIVNDIHTLNSLILKGAGIAFCHDILTQKALDDGQLVRLFPEMAPISVGMDIVRKATRSDNLLLETFWNFARESNPEQSPE